MVTETNHGESQAKAQLESIEIMMDRLEHAQECDWSEPGDECDREHSEILEGLQLATGDREPTEEEYREYHDEEKAREMIQEDPLSVEVRSGWVTPGHNSVDGIMPFEAEEYCILLCTGGPAARIIGRLNEHSEPECAELEYQDWGTPWTFYAGNYNHPALLEYARQFWFGE